MPRARSADGGATAMTTEAAGSIVGVLVMAYGTPASPDDIEAYYTHIRRGRPPTEDQLANLRGRYDALGGISTLARRTADQVATLADALEAIEPGRFVVTLGQKHAAPFIEDGVAELAALGASSVVGVVLAPHYSGFSVGQYQARVTEAAEPLGLATAAVNRWHDLGEYRAFLTGSVRDALVDLPDATEVVFTAHSLPERVLADDPYPDELMASATAVAVELGLRSREASDEPDLGPGHRWSIGWQSAGATPEPWRGPDISEILRDRAASGEVEAVLVCAQGFVADHLEVAYDLDIKTQALADELGIGFARTRTLNHDHTVLAALARRIVETRSHA